MNGVKDAVDFARSLPQPIAKILKHVAQSNLSTTIADRRQQLQGQQPSSNSSSSSPNMQPADRFRDCSFPFAQVSTHIQGDPVLRSGIPTILEDVAYVNDPLHRACTYYGNSRGSFSWNFLLAAVVLAVLSHNTDFVLRNLSSLPLVFGMTLQTLLFNAKLSLGF